MTTVHTTPGRWLAASFAFACAAALLLPAAALAQYGPETGATIDTGRNIYKFAATVRTKAPVAGDFVGAGGRVVIDHPVSGDLAVAGGSVDVRGAVSDDVRAAAGDISIDARVGGELFATAGKVTVGRTAVIGRNTRLYGESVTIDGVVEGKLVVAAERIVLNGEVRGDVDFSGDRISLGPQARVTGAFTYESESELVRAEGATIAGAITRKDPEEREGRRIEAPDTIRIGGSMLGGVFGFFGLLVCAALYLLVAPAFGERAAARVGATPWLALGIGFATLLAVPVGAILLFVTLLGIPLGIVAMMLYPVLMLFGFLTGAIFVARHLPNAIRRPDPLTFSSRLAYVAAALVIAAVVSMVPFAGGVLLLLVMVAGLGAFVLELYARRPGAGGRAPGVTAHA